jgi:hypothetical protein
MGYQYDRCLHVEASVAVLWKTNPIIAYISILPEIGAVVNVSQERLAEVVDA